MTPFARDIQAMANVGDKRIEMTVVTAAQFLRSFRKIIIPKNSERCLEDNHICRVFGGVMRCTECRPVNPEYLRRAS